MRLWHLILCIAAVVGGTTLDAAGSGQMQQGLGEAWRWSRFGPESGVPPGDVLGIVENPRGEVWVHTPEGIGWFDGYQWRAVTTGLPSREDLGAGAIVADSAGILFCSNTRLYRVTADSFSVVPIRWKGEPRPVLAAAPFPGGGMIVETDSILLHVTPSLTRLIPFPEHRGARPPLLGRPFGIVSPRVGSLWINTSDGLFTWSGDGWRQRVGARPDYFDIRGFAENSRGTGVASTQMGAASVFVEWGTGHETAITHMSAGDFATSLAVQENDDLFSVLQSGSVRLRVNGRWLTLASVPAPLKNVTCARFRENGDLWVGSASGLFLCRLSSTLWSSWRPSVAEGGSYANEVLVRANGELWVGTGNGIAIRTPSGAERSITAIEGQRLGIVTGLAEESDGHVWVSSGASFAGAFHWDGQRWRRVRGPSSPNTPVHRIARDRRGHLWFLALGPAPAGLAPEEEPGAWVFDGRSFRHMGVEEGLLNGRVYAFAEDSIGGLWFGTYTGISRLRGGAWRHWTTRDGLREGKVFTLAVDLQNRVWFGHQHSGLGVIDSTDGIRYITRSDGLVGNSVWGLEVDDEGTLWVATRSGVSRLRGGIWSSFTELTGLNSPFTWALKARDRVLYVGTSGGGVNEFRYGQYTSPTPIVEIQEPVQRGRGMAFAWATFAAWGEIPPTAIETRYAVDEGPWSRWDRKRDLYLDSLPSGMHIFRVQAKGLLGAVRTPSTSIGFEVYPPLPLRPGFYVPVGVLLLLLVAGGGVGIARKRRYDRALRETARRIAAVLEAVEEGITLSDASGHFELFNSKFQKLTGYSVDEANADRDFLERLYPERSDLHRVLDAFHTLLTTRLPQEVEAQILRKDGVRRTLLVNMILFEHNARGQFLSSYRDITERKQVEERLRVSLAEKEVLLKEIHHRVKNNMQVISSLLNLQLNLLDDEEMREILRESQNRIKSMALIHEGLYRSENLAGVDFATYVSQLARSVVRSYTTAPVELLLDVGNVQLSIDMAIPCGLILNELISNAMKYAFPGGRAGTVSVKVCRTDEGMVKLEVADNGVGLPPTLDIRESKSMGLQLVTTLVNQLGGTLDAVRGTGARFVISFQA